MRGDAPDPELPALALIASHRRAVRDAVVGHQELDPRPVVEWSGRRPRPGFGMSWVRTADPNTSCDPHRQATRAHSARLLSPQRRSPQLHAARPAAPRPRSARFQIPIGRGPSVPRPLASLELRHGPTSRHSGVRGNTRYATDIADTNADCARRLGVLPPTVGRQRIGLRRGRVALECGTVAASSVATRVADTTRAWSWTQGLDGAKRARATCERLARCVSRRCD